MRALTMMLGMCGALIGSSAGIAHADRVHLVEGAVIEGKVSRHGDKVVIELESGKLTLPADAVAKIEDGASPVQRFEQLQAEQSKRGVSGLMVLADFCRDHDMRAREQTLLAQVIAAQPEHAQARARLGYVKGESGWAKPVPVAKDEDDFVARDRILERERQRAEAKLAEQDRQKAALELEAQKVALERQKVALELERERLANAKAADELSTTRYVVNSGPYVDHHHCRHDACEPARRVRRSKPFPIAGVRDPRDTSWPIVGVKDPRSDL